MNPIAGKLHLAANKKNLGIYTENGTRIAFINATLTSDEQIGTYIVRAVNSHQSLIDALSEAVNLFRGGDLTNEQAHALWKADAALALAKEPT